MRERFNFLHRVCTIAHLKWVLGHQAFTLGILLITIAINVYLLVIVPKGFFPLQDNGAAGRRYSCFARHFISGHEIDGLAVRRHYQV